MNRFILDRKPKPARIKEFFFLLRHSPEYLYALVIVTFFSVGIIIGQYLKDGGYL